MELQTILPGLLDYPMRGFEMWDDPETGKAELGGGSSAFPSDY